MNKNKYPRIALLTTGKGALAHTCFTVLQKSQRLHAVVFSKKIKKKRSVLEKVREVGLWYSAQQFFTLLGNHLADYAVSKTVLDTTNIVTENWYEKDDQTRVLSLLREQQIDTVIICGFQHILRSSFFNQFNHCINLHPALLPQYRGPEPIVWGLLRGEQQFGVTLHQVDDGIDTGAIVLQQKIKAPLIPLLFSVEHQLAQTLPALLNKLLEDIQSQKINPQQQSTGGFYLPTATLANRNRYHQR